MTPAFNAAGSSPPLSKRLLLTGAATAPYSPSTTDTVAGLSSPDFLNTYGSHPPSNVQQNILTETAFLFIWMGVLMLIFLICATRTNAVYVAIFTTLTLVFVFLSGAYWRLAVADAIVGNRLIVVRPSLLPVACAMANTDGMYRQPVLHCSWRACWVSISWWRSCLIRWGFLCVCLLGI
jgi:hypothetical protein